jgi:hypothetical protein
MIAASTSLPPSEDTTFLPAGNGTGTTTSGDYNEDIDRRMESPYPTPSQPLPAAFDFSDMIAGTTPYPTNFDSFAWIFENNLDEVFPSMPPSPGHDLSAMDVEATWAKVDGQQHLRLVGEDGDVVGPDGQLDDLPQPTPRDHCNPDDVWPMEWHAASAQPLTLPTLGSAGDERDTNSGFFFSIKSVSEPARAKMVNSIRLPLQRSPWQTVSLANFPSKEKLDHCIDLFFRHLDRVCPEMPPRLV